MKVLIAEDAPVCRCLLKSMLTEWGYEVVVACDGLQALEVLGRPDSPRLAILDWMMPGLDGDQVVREIRKRAEERYVYTVLLTARSQTNDIVNGLACGADDYLCKPFEPLELQARLQTGCRLLKLQEQLVTTREEMRYQATHDALTGVWNQPAILDLCERELSRSRREAKPVGLLLADLDHFKRVNDRYGHLAGNAVLDEISRRMRASLRAYDMVGRFGGEEFLIVLPGCDVNNTVRLAERLRGRIADQPVLYQGAAIPVTTSLGVVVSQPADTPADVQRLLQAADTALYRAKDNGRNRVEVGSTAAGLPEDRLLQSRLEAGCDPTPGRLNAGLQHAGAR